MSVKFFGQYLIEQAVVDDGHVREALELLDRTNRSVGQVAVDEGMLTEAEADRINLAQRGMDRSFGDLAVEVEVFVAEGERVAWQRTLRGVHRASFQGFPPTGRVLEWRDMFVSRFADEVIAEEWMVSDLAGQLLRARKR